jgi:hypothetical protein
MSAITRLDNGYIYEPLLSSEVPASPGAPGNSIRLLSFSKSATATSTSSTRSQDVQVTLRTHKLSEDLKYDALSYEWGQEGEMETILLDGKLLSIPRSLYLFLKVLRASPDANATPLFADAICIDQQNLQERASQVQLMGQVYTSARRVHIWLGPERAGIGLLFKFCNVLKGSETDGKVRGRFEEIFGEHNEAAFQEAVQAFTTCSYWRRLWVIQEILLAKELRVHCGKYQVNWNALYEGCQRVLLGEVWKSQSDPSSSFGGAPGAIAEATPEDFDHSRYVSLYLQTMSGGPSELATRARSSLRATRSKRLYNLKDAISLHGLAECTDPHDRVYGLLGLVLRGNDSGYFSADYGEHLSTLFQRVMYQCRADLRTGAIAFCRHLRHVLGLPFASGRENLRPASDSSERAGFMLLPSLQYNIVVRYAGRLDREITKPPDKASSGALPSETNLELSTWSVRDRDIFWSTSGDAQSGDLIYSIDDSCCGAIFRKMAKQPDSKLRRKRSAALQPLFIGRAIAHKPWKLGDADHTAAKSLLRAEQQFASKLFGERPLLEIPGAPWESQVPLSELWELTCDLEGIEILHHSVTLSHSKTNRSNSPHRRPNGTGMPEKKKRRFDFQWTSEAANSQ